MAQKVQLEIQSKLIDSLKYKSPKSGGFMGRLEEAMKKQEELKNR